MENLEWRTGSTWDQPTTAVIVVTEVTGNQFKFNSSQEAASYLGKSKTAIFNSFGKGFVDGFKAGPAKRTELEPGPDDTIKVLNFGRHIVGVTDVRADEVPWRKPDTANRGYLRTTFQFDRDGHTKRSSSGDVVSQSFDLHRLVCEAFHGPPPPHHKDNNKLNRQP